MVSNEHEIFEGSRSIKNVNYIFYGSVTLFGIYQAYYQLVNGVSSINYATLIVGLFLLMYSINETSNYFVLYLDGSFRIYKGFLAKEYYFLNNEIQKIALHRNFGKGTAAAIILIRENKKEIHRFEFDQETIDRSKACLSKQYKERFEYCVNGVRQLY